MQNTKNIQNWLGTGSINLFGKPLSGKDTVGLELAKLLKAYLLSSGQVLRDNGELVQKTGLLTPSETFKQIVLPHFFLPKYQNRPLILSSIGRWHGEEPDVINTANLSNHPIKAVVFLNVADDEILSRWQISRSLKDRAERADDSNEEAIQRRLQEFQTKTLPVLQFYKNHGLLIEVNGDQNRPAVLEETIQKLTEFSRQQYTT